MQKKEKDILIPEDIYEVILLKTDIVNSSTNRPMLMMRWIIDKGDYFGKAIHSYIMLDSDKTLEVLNIIKEILGFRRNDIDLQNIEKMYKKKCRIKVVHTEDQDQNKYYTVGRYYPMAED